MFLLEALEENLSVAFMASRGHLHSLAHGPTIHLFFFFTLFSPSIFKARKAASSNLSLCPSASIVTSQALVLLLHKPYYYIELTKIIHNDLLISCAKSL